MNTSKRFDSHSTTASLKHNNNGDNNANIWSSILKGVANQRVIHTKNVLILGDPSSGKSTLVDHLESDIPTSRTSLVSFSQISTRGLADTKDQPQMNKYETKKHLGLGFNYTTIYDEDNEDMARLGIYQLSTPEHSSLLRFVLNMETIQNTMIVIVLDWSKPWSFIEKLQQWIQVIHQTILSLYQQDPKNKVVLEASCQNVLGYMKHYRESGSDKNISSTSLSGIIAEQVDLPLAEGTLSINYGIPLAVVCCKSDKQLMLETTLDCRENRFDYIQQTLRTICMKYGAALFYTSTYHPQTFSQLRQYILNRTLSTQINNQVRTLAYYSYQEKAQVMDRDIVMVPAGWDTWGKIKALHKEFDCQQAGERWDIDMGALEDRQPVTDLGLQSVYKENIVDPDADYQPLMVPSVTICEDEQVVLKRHFDSLQRIGGGTSSSTLSKLKSSTEPRLLGTIGPASSSLTSTLDILHATNDPLPPSIPTQTKDLKAPTKKLIWDKLNKGSTIPLTTSASDTITTTGNSTAVPLLSETGNSSSTTTMNTNTSNVILNNFFQSLLSKKSPSASSSSSSIQHDPVTTTAYDPETTTTSSLASARATDLVNQKEVQKRSAFMQQLQQQQHSLYG